MRDPSALSMNEGSYSQNSREGYSWVLLFEKKYLADKGENRVKKNLQLI